MVSTWDVVGRLPAGHLLGCLRLPAGYRPGRRGRCPPGNPNGRSRPPGRSPGEWRAGLRHGTRIDRTRWPRSPSSATQLESGRRSARRALDPVVLSARLSMTAVLEFRRSSGPILVAHRRPSDRGSGGRVATALETGWAPPARRSAIPFRWRAPAMVERASGRRGDRAPRRPINPCPEIYSAARWKTSGDPKTGSRSPPPSSPSSIIESARAAPTAGSRRGRGPPSAAPRTRAARRARRARIPRGGGRATQRPRRPRLGRPAAPAPRRRGRGPGRPRSRVPGPPPC